MKILFVNHAKHRCGVYQFGRLTWDVLSQSKQHEFYYIECSSVDDLLKKCAETVFDGFLINYHDQTVPWFTQEVVDVLLNWGKVFCITGHDHTVNFRGTTSIIPDPTLAETTQRVQKVGRLVLPYENKSPMPEIPTIGTFGFGFEQKNFARLVYLVNDQFKRAVIRVHLPANDFADPSGGMGAYFASLCAKLAKPGIKVEASTDFLSVPALLDWLAANSINVFVYDDQPGRGISSTIDFALACGRPLAISKSSMFRHIYTEESIVVDNFTLPQIIAKGTEPLSQFRALWKPENLIQDYENILDK